MVKHFSISYACACVCLWRWCIVAQWLNESTWLLVWGSAQDSVRRGSRSAHRKEDLNPEVGARLTKISAGQSLCRCYLFTVQVCFLATVGRPSTCWARNSWIPHVTKPPASQHFYLPWIMTFGWSLHGRMSSQSASLAAIVSGKLYNIMTTE